MAHVTKRPTSKGEPRWQAAFRGPNGKERTKTFAKKIDAERWLTSVEHSKLTGTYVDPAAGKVTFRSFAEEWRKMQAHRPGTSVSVEIHLRLHIYPSLGDRPIAAIRPSEIQGLVTKLGATLAPSTVAVVVGRVVSVFNAAVLDRVIPSSPCLGLKLPTSPATSTLDLLTTEQVFGIADAIAARYRAMVVAGAGLGLRPGELFGLAVDRVDFLRRTVRVDQQVARVATGGVGLAPLKTKASYRTIPLPAVVGDALAAHMATYEPHADLGLIFTTSRGGPVQQHPWAEVWGTARKKAGAPKWATPHDLRHFYASMLIRGGASVKVVQARLGHASAKVTLDVYGHLWADEEDRTRKAVDTLFRAPKSESAADITRTSSTL
jgi:integrase